MVPVDDDDHLYSQISLGCQPPVTISDPQPHTIPLNHIPERSPTVTNTSKPDAGGVSSYEQKRYVADSGQCISEYIAQIEGRTVVAPSVLSAGLCRDNDLRRVDRLDRDIGFIQERQRGVEQRVVSTRDGGEFHGRAGGDQDSARIPDHVPKFLSLFLGQKENQYR